MRWACSGAVCYWPILYEGLLPTPRLQRPAWLVSIVYSLVNCQNDSMDTAVQYKDGPKKLRLRRANFTTLLTLSINDKIYCVRTRGYNLYF